MKLEFVEVAGFRGFRDKTRFDLPAGFAILSGRNGSGKSTLLDAIDFAITGNINKFSVETARGGGLADHIWWLGDTPASAHYVSVGFVSGDGASFRITRSRDQGCTTDSAKIVGQLCRAGTSIPASVEALMQTTLIRDERIAALSLDLPGHARFEAVRAAIGGLAGPDYSERTGSILTAAAAAKTKHANRAEELRSEIGRLLTEITDARSTVQRSSGISEALRVIGSLAPGLPDGLAEQTEAIRKTIADKRVALRELDRGRAVAQESLPEIAYFASPDTSAAIAAARAEEELAQRAKLRTDELVEMASAANESEKAINEYMAHMTAILDHGSAMGLQDGLCPLCKAARTEEQFMSAITTLRESLGNRAKRLSDASAALKRAQTAAREAEQTLAAAQVRYATFERRRVGLQQKLNEVQRIYARHGFEVPADDPKRAQALILAEQERVIQLERALAVLEASGAVDLVKTLESRVAATRERSEQEAAKLAAAERAHEAARQINAASQSVANQILMEQFDTVMPLLKELYRRLRPHVDWSEIDSDFGGKVRGSLNFLVGDGYNPQFLFSSGQRRAAGLAFLLAVHLARPWCSWRSLLLDDPVQHVDDYRALNLVEVLTAIRRTGRQVVVAVEDAALANLLCRRLRSATDEGGRHFGLRMSKSGSAEIAESQDIYPMPRLVLRSA
jgi:DNA repair exonuclease SbcCD ATPase subunit